MTTDNLIRVVEIYPAIEGEGMMTGTPEIILRLFGCNLTCDYCDEERAWKDGILHPEEIQLFSTGEALLTRIQQVQREVEWPIEWISITGGEPLARPVEQLIQIVTALKSVGYKVAIQTNGSLARPALFPLVDFWSVTPTLNSSGHSILTRPKYLSTVEQFLGQMRAVIVNRDMVRGQLKFVLGSDEDIAEADTLVDKWEDGLLGPGKVPIIVQPMWPRMKSATADNQRGEWETDLTVRTNAAIFSRHPTVLKWPRVRVMLQQHKMIHGPDSEGSM